MAIERARREKAAARAAAYRREMLRAVTVPPTEDEVARAAAEVSEGAIGPVDVRPWPRGHSHHAYHLRADDGQEYLFKVHRRPHPGRMRRFLHLAALLSANDVPHPRLRWADLDRRTLEVPYLIQEFVPGEDAGTLAGQLSFADQHRVGAELGSGLAALHAIEYVDTPTAWATEFDDRLRTRAAECRTLDALDHEEQARVIAFYEARRQALEGVQRTVTHDELEPENLLLAKGADGWHFAALLDFERARGRDPVLDLAQLDLTTFPQWPAMGAAFATGYAGAARLGPYVPERRELYAMYLLLAGIVYYRENEAPAREAAARTGLRRWLESGPR